ncbi:MAG: ABC transporter ATP-binding protein [Candidatus Izemoplasmataceae bacterium]
MKGLVVDNITKSFKLSYKQRKLEDTKERKKIAVNGLSFTANPGEIYGLLGPNGAGKTTTLRCISTLIHPDSGDILVNGKSVLEDSLDVRKDIAFLTTELKLDEHFTPNYLFDYFADLHGLDEETKNERKTMLFERFGIDRFQEVKVSDLSSGMKQKTSLAIALVHDPSVIVFDEPTNGLDVLTAKTVTDYLLELKDQGKVVVISTHILSVVEKICDRVGIILDGSIKVSDTFDNVCALSHDGTLEGIFFEYMEESGVSDA